MKTYKYIIFASFIAFAGCNKIIDLYPESNLNTGTYYSNYNEVNTALSGCYKGMQVTLNEEWSLTELRSDNSIQGVAGSQSTVNRDLSDLDMFMLNTSHQGNFNYWAAVYANIRNINLVLNALQVNYSESTGTIAYDNLTIPVTEADRKLLAAQAQFLRAYHYFNLVRLYGGAFLIHEPTDPEAAKSINRTTVAEMYKLIEADLLSAAQYGNTAKFTSIATDDFGKANSWSAKALLAKVYLTQGKKTEAITLLQDVISNSGYSLQSTYANVFSINNEMNSEILFAIRFKGGGVGVGSPLPNFFAPLQSGSAVVNGDGRGYNYPTTSVINSYLKLTFANSATLTGSTTITLPVSPSTDSISVGMYVTGTQIPNNATVTAVTGNIITISAAATATSAIATLTIGDIRRTNSIGLYAGVKYYPIKLISNPTIASDAENDWIVIRYADVLLMMAEAQGNGTTAMGYINQIRTRAKLKTILPANVTTTAQFETILSNERRYELAFENQRYFDLLRYNVTFTTINATQTLKDHITAEFPFHYSSYPAPILTAAQIQANITNDRLLLPIPQREIDNNTRIVIPQNPGY